MAQPNFSAYLALLDSLGQELRRLCAVERDKIAAVRAHDLDALNDCIKREQAAALSLRGREQQRDALLKALGLEGVPLRELPRRCPPERRAQAARAVESLLRDYAVLRSVQAPARDLLERERKAVDAALEARGAASGEGSSPAAGRRSPGPFHTDFRA